MARPSKQFKKFAASGKLTDTIKKRRATKEKKKKFDEKVQQRIHQRGARRPEHEISDDEAGDDDDEQASKGPGGGKAGGVAKTVDELFGAGGLEVPFEEGSDLEDLSEADEDEDDDDEDSEGPEDEDFDEEAMKKAMAALEKNDPEFFKHLKAEDPELLNFGKGKNRMDVDEDDSEDEDADEEMDEDVADDDVAPRKTVVTMKMLRGWREAMLKQHSLRSLRKMLLAFRAAAHMNEDEGAQGEGLETKYTIPSAEVFNKLVLTALKFTPVVLAHHLPYKTLPNGRIRLQAAKKSAPANLDRLILSHFSTLLHLIKSLPTTPSAISGDDEADAGSLLATAVAESAKLIPWILSARKHLRAYLKVLLDLWSSASDSVRVAAFLAIRKLFVAGDEAVKDIALRNIYRALLPPMRLTSVHTLPSINLMKNTAAELYQLDPQLAYQHAFTFIRMLAVHLRTVVRSATSGKGGEDGQAFRSVYNWAFVHSIDFWSQVLAGAAGTEAQAARGGLESPLKPLIYPLVQIALGAVRLLPSSRYFPLRFHIIASLIRLVSQTETYIPLSPFLLEILDSSEFRRSNPKKATLKPLDLAYVIRAPAAYPKTRVYQEVLGEELVWLLADFHAQLSNHISYPELVLPVIVSVKRHIKRGTAGSPKVANQLKTLVDKLEANRTFIEGKRRNVGFAPRDRAEVARFKEGIKVETTPLGTWVKVQRKVRAQRRKEIEKALREQESDDEE
ncbi:noc2p [Trichosporon asahii var. asahii CBS 2479]|uniref:Noc2p n=1 Tax=Trichosporon asahii var. asahii (strain ATCC 90039 / CBS 2479 / JCM 2466 / KCTC 7840 / NBRC 103889/ NCYC 2677 / UAMH 7654) TaxID=1186058 RepID=J4UGP7_TRIAS|nr:noc2p [Trichosporon asahii var. asahii CBS 2479]EJT50655.1 noc2p [Trichosporon asahii var. asahii CBS 2479]